MYQQPGEKRKISTKFTPKDNAREQCCGREINEEKEMIKEDKQRQPPKLALCRIHMKTQQIKIDVCAEKNVN